MKPAWDQLMKDFDGQVFDVDCTAGGESLCKEMGVEGYPMLKFGQPDALEKYEGGRDIDELTEFAKKILGPQCTIDNMDPCTDLEKQHINAALKKEPSELVREIKDLEGYYATRQKKIHKKAEKFKEKQREFEDDRDERRGQKPKKGKEKEFEAQQAKMRERKAKLDAEDKAINDDQEGLMKQIAMSGIKFMKMAAKANKAGAHKEL